MSGDVKHNPTSPIQRYRSRGTDRPEHQNIFSTFVTLTSTSPGARISNAATTSQAPTVSGNFYGDKRQIHSRPK
jgi:hypothetical protein